MVMQCSNWDHWDLLSGRLMQTKPSTSAAPAQPNPVVVVPTMESMPGINESTLPKPKLLKFSNDSQHCCITPTLLSSLSSTSSVSFPVVAVPKLVVPAEAYLECLNRPGGGKDYLCFLCPFRRSNLDSILTYVKKHSDITIECPICGKGYQNATSLHKHGRDVNSIQIVASSTSLPGVIPEEEI